MFCNFSFEKDAKGGIYVGLPVVETTTGLLVEEEEGKEENPLTEVVVILSGSKFMICNSIKIKRVSFNVTVWNES